MQDKDKISKNVIFSEDLQKFQELPPEKRTAIVFVPNIPKINDLNINSYRSQKNLYDDLLRYLVTLFGGGIVIYLGIKSIEFFLNLLSQREIKAVIKAIDNLTKTFGSIVFIPEDCKNELRNFGISLEPSISGYFYLRSPVESTTYYSIEKYNESIIVSQYNELLELLASLGAKRILVYLSDEYELEKELAEKLGLTLNFKISDDAINLLDFKIPDVTLDSGIERNIKKSKRWKIVYMAEYKEARDPDVSVKERLLWFHKLPIFQQIYKDRVERELVELKSLFELGKKYMINQNIFTDVDLACSVLGIKLDTKFRDKLEKIIYTKLLVVAHFKT